MGVVVDFAVLNSLGKNRIRMYINYYYMEIKMGILRHIRMDEMTARCVFDTFYHKLLVGFFLIPQNDPVLVVFQFCFRDICQGMSYLEERNIVHRWVGFKAHVWGGTRSMHHSICFV